MWWRRSHFVYNGNVGGVLPPPHHVPHPWGGACLSPFPTLPRRRVRAAWAGSSLLALCASRAGVRQPPVPLGATPGRSALAMLVSCGCGPRPGRRALTPLAARALVRQAPSRRGLLVHGCIQWHVRGVLPLPHIGLPLELSLPSRALLPRGRTAAVGPPRLVAVGACCAALAVPCLCQPCTTLNRPFLRTLAWSCIAASLRRLRLGMA